MKIATWNVNSIRARESVVLDWVEANEPDVLLMQETKISDQEFPEDAFGDLDYDVVYYGQATYNGVAIASRHPIEDVVMGLPGDDDAAERRLIAATIRGIRTVCVYVPNGRTVGSETFRYKLDWLDRLHAFMEQTTRPDQPVVLAGDFNIAPTDDDVWDQLLFQNVLFCTEDERSRYRRLLSLGLVDLVAHVHKEPKQFTWWDYRAGNFQKNRGLRIDHILATKPIVERLRAISLDREVRAKHDPSDHIPVTLSLNDP
jgi:exodeoxyribonuclease-3